MLLRGHAIADCISPHSPGSTFINVRVRDGSRIVVIYASVVVVVASVWVLSFVFPVMGSVVVVDFDFRSWVRSLILSLVIDGVAVRKLHW